MAFEVFQAVLIFLPNKAIMELFRSLLIVLHVGLDVVPDISDTQMVVTRLDQVLLLGFSPSFAAFHRFFYL